jgi:hypothetical protein
MSGTLVLTIYHTCKSIYLIYFAYTLNVCLLPVYKITDHRAILIYLGHKSIYLIYFISTHENHICSTYKITGHNCGYIILMN